MFDVSYRKQLITCNKNNRVCGANDFTCETFINTVFTLNKYR